MSDAADLSTDPSPAPEDPVPTRAARASRGLETWLLVVAGWLFLAGLGVSLPLRAYVSSDGAARYVGEHLGALRESTELWIGAGYVPEVVGRWRVVTVERLSASQAIANALFLFFTNLVGVVLPIAGFGARLVALPMSIGGGFGVAAAAAAIALAAALVEPLRAATSALLVGAVLGVQAAGVVGAVSAGVVAVVAGAAGAAAGVAPAWILALTRRRPARDRDARGSAPVAIGPPGAFETFKEP